MKNRASIIVFVTFVIHGFIATTKKHFTTDNLVGIFLSITIWVIGLYYFYLNELTEKEKTELTEHDKKLNKIDDWIVVIQGICFHILWLLFETETNLYYCAIDIIVLNVSYLFWDYIHKNEIKSPQIGKLYVVCVFDVAGFLISVFFLKLAPNLPPEVLDSNDKAHIAVWLVLICGLFIFHAIIGFFVSSILYKHFKPIKATAEETTVAGMEQEKPITNP